MLHSVDIVGRWEIELPSTWTDSWHGDGFHVFQRSGMELWTAVYVDPNSDPARAVAEYLEDCENVTMLPTDIPGAVAAGYRSEWRERHFFTAVIGGSDCLVKLAFRFDDPAAFEEAMTILQSVRLVSDD